MKSVVSIFYHCLINRPTWNELGIDQIPNKYHWVRTYINFAWKVNSALNFLFDNTNPDWSSRFPVLRIPNPYIKNWGIIFWFLQRRSILREIWHFDEYMLIDSLNRFPHKLKQLLSINFCFHYWTNCLVNYWWSIILI